MFGITIHDNSDEGMMVDKYYTTTSAGVSRFARMKLEEMGFMDPKEQFKYLDQLESNGELVVNGMIFKLETDVPFNPVMLMENEEDVLVGSSKRKTRKTKTVKRGGMKYCGAKMRNGKTCQCAGTYGGKCKRHAK